MVDASDDVDLDFAHRLHHVADGVHVNTYDATPVISRASNGSSNDSSRAHRLHQGGNLSKAQNIP